MFQALETDAQVDGLLRCVRQHMAVGGSCVITMYKPRFEPDVLRERWPTEEETKDWEAVIDGERIVASDRRRRMDRDRLVLYPELVFRRYRGDVQVDEVVMPITMRCWYPEQVFRLLESRGFQVVNTWGGYAGEAFGEGQELIVQFRESDGTSPVPVGP